MPCMCATQEKTSGCCKDLQGFERPSWDQYFLEIAAVVSKRATCLRRRYGAVIVKDNVIVGTGYCGAPRGEANCTDIGHCEREALNVPPGERYELCRSTHAEMNAIINSDPERMIGATIYVSGFDAKTGAPAEGKPCMLCERMIKNARISRVVYRKRDGTFVESLI